MKRSSDAEIRNIAINTLLGDPTVNFSRSKIFAGSPVIVKYLSSENGYYLVPVYSDLGLCGIVQLSLKELFKESHCVIQDTGKSFLMSLEEVLEIVKKKLPELELSGKPYLGWKPCRESFSSISPFWVLNSNNGTKFVSQSGEVFDKLTSGPGG